jgi:hypothetical protein
MVPHSIAMPSPFTSLRALLFLWASVARWVTAQNVTDCPGYSASNVETTDGGMTADLTLAGDACNAYGKDLHDLKFMVEYQTGTLFLARTAALLLGSVVRRLDSGAGRCSICCIPRCRTCFRTITEKLQ